MAVKLTYQIFHQDKKKNNIYLSKENKKEQKKNPDIMYQLKCGQARKIFR